MFSDPTRPTRRHGFEVPLELDAGDELADALPGLELVEIIPEGFFQGKRANLLTALGRAGTPVMVHSVEMSLGTDAPFPQAHFDRIRRVIDSVNCVGYSDHLCMTRAGGREIGQLTTLPFTDDAVSAFCRNVDELLGQLGRVPFLIENITNRFVAPHSTLSEPAFVRACLERTGIGLLLDVTNLYTNSVNFRFDPRRWLAALGPVVRVAGIHLAGGEWEGETLYDTHSQAVPDDVWELYAEVLRRHDPELVVVEWDQSPPPLARLLAEVAGGAPALAAGPGGESPMSLAGFQDNMASLLRNPEDWRPEGELTDAERASLLALADDAEVGKYAREQREQRWLATWRKLPRLRQVVGDELLYEFWVGAFDPEHPRLESDGSSLAGTATFAFLDFLAESTEAAQAFVEAGVHASVHDVLAFERAELALTLPVDLGAFRVVELSHDLLAGGDGAPGERRTLAALVRRGAGLRPRVFEIDDAMARALRGLGDGTPGAEPGAEPWADPGEGTLADLEAMGLGDLVRAARRH